MQASVLPRMNGLGARRRAGAAAAALPAAAAAAAPARSAVVRRHGRARDARPPPPSAAAAPGPTATASSSSAQADPADTNATTTTTTTAKYFGQGDARPIILYDGVCNLCNGAVDVMLRLDPRRPGRVRLAALQSPAGRALLKRSGRAEDDISSIVLVERDGFYIRSEAVRRIAAGLGAPTLLPLLAAAAAPVPLFLRDKAYDMVADNRYGLFGRTRECRLSDRSPGREFEERFVTY